MISCEEQPRSQNIRRFSAALRDFSSIYVRFEFHSSFTETFSTVSVMTEVPDCRARRQRQSVKDCTPPVVGCRLVCVDDDGLRPNLAAAPGENRLAQAGKGQDGGRAWRLVPKEEPDLVEAGGRRDNRLRHLAHVLDIVARERHFGAVLELDNGVHSAS